jgi:hypothetical protein
MVLMLKLANDRSNDIDLPDYVHDFRYGTHPAVSPR